MAQFNSASNENSIALEALHRDVIDLRADIAAHAQDLLQGLCGSAVVPAQHRPAIENLCHYLSLRHRDLRVLQRELMWRGLSSLGRLESRVLPTLDAVSAALSGLQGVASHLDELSESKFFAGERSLRKRGLRPIGLGVF
ncbi:hypothetical protein [Agrobacterium vitis]|uniref:hypothetical protein n=1 Tax=Agrobacterium vitis TaxID=373 RepID=UPI003B53003A